MKFGSVMTFLQVFWQCDHFHLLKARLKFAADHTDKEKNLPEENKRNKSCLDPTPNLLPSMVLVALYAVRLFCCWWICCSKETKCNNGEGGLSPNSSGKPKIISQKIWALMQQEINPKWSSPHREHLDRAEETKTNLVEFYRFCPEVDQKLVDGRETFNQISESLYVYFWPSRFCNILTRPLITSSLNQTSWIFLRQSVLLTGTWES